VRSVRPGDEAARASAAARRQRPPRKHAGELALAVAAVWDRVHPWLTHRAAWLDHDGDLPAIEGALIRLQT
jgi:hypothetical protein